MRRQPQFTQHRAEIGGDAFHRVAIGCGEGLQIAQVQNPIAIEIQHIEEAAGSSLDEGTGLFRIGLIGRLHALVRGHEFLQFDQAVTIAVPALLFMGVGAEQKLQQVGEGWYPALPAGMDAAGDGVEVLLERVQPVAIAVIETEQTPVAIDQHLWNDHGKGGRKRAPTIRVPAGQPIAAAGRSRLLQSERSGRRDHAGSQPAVLGSDVRTLQQGSGVCSHQVIQRSADAGGPADAEDTKSHVTPELQCAPSTEGQGQNRLIFISLARMREASSELSGLIRISIACHRAFQDN